MNRRYRRPLFHPNRGLPINDGYLKVVSFTTQTEGNMEATMKRNIIYVGLDVDDTQTRVQH